MSLCQMPPKFTVSCGSFVTAMISGKPSMPFTNGYSTGSPMRRANARNSSGSSDLVAEEHDEVLEPRPPDLGHRLVGEVASRGRRRVISAPSAPAIGATLIVRYGSSLVIARRACSSRGLGAQLPAEIHLADLARRGAREVVDDPQLLRPLLAGEPDALELRR